MSNINLHEILNGNVQNKSQEKRIVGNYKNGSMLDRFHEWLGERKTKPKAKLKN